MSFKPLYDRVAIKPLDQEAKTPGGIIIPDTAKEKPMEGKIVAVGSGTRDDQGKITALTVKVGDVVVYGKWAGTEINVDGDDLVIMKESDIIGIRG